MADVTEEQIRRAVERATAEVFSEARSFDTERFRVADLRGQLDEFVGGKLSPDTAWTITYTTSQIAAGALESLGEQAWTISYSTSRVGMEEQLEAPAKTTTRRSRS